MPSIKYRKIGSECLPGREDRKKATKIEAALFSLWCHPRRRRLKKRRRWFQLYAEWKIRLSLSPPAPWEEDAKLDEYFSEEEEEEGTRRSPALSPRPICFPIKKRSIFRREREREIKRGYLSLLSTKSDDDGNEKEGVIFGERER